MNGAPKRRLIVNADDFNLTAGVNAAILDAHDSGIVSSTTILINMPLAAKTIEALRVRPELGLGLHLNVTLGAPVTAPEEIPSLVTPDGVFRKRKEVLETLPLVSEIRLEYENQIKAFSARFDKLPTHLDTHHQLHDYPAFFTALSEVAQEYRLPVRRSKQTGSGPEIPTTDHFFGDLDPAGYWRPETLSRTLQNLPPGLSEIMCHPGTLDPDLEAITSFTHGRVREWRLFRTSTLRRTLAELQIDLVHYRVCYT